MEFEVWAQSARDKLTAHYGADYETHLNVELGDIIAPVLFSMRSRPPQSYMGFTIKNAPPSPEACELVFILQERIFAMHTLALVQELIYRAEKEYIQPVEDRGFAFVSAAVLCESAEKDAENALKKYKLRREYVKGGWMMARTAVMLQNGAPLCNKDGIDFRNLLKAVMQDETPPENR